MYIIEDIWREIKTYLFHNIKIHGKHLKNDKITLNILVNKKTIKKTQYSDKEKYNILLKKNSELDKLRTTFDLEF